MNAQIVAIEPLILKRESAKDFKRPLVSRDAQIIKFPKPKAKPRARKSGAPVHS